MNPDPTPKIAHQEPIKVKKDPHIMSKSKVRIEGTIENKSFSTKRVDIKTNFEPYPSPKNSPLVAQEIEK